MSDQEIKIGEVSVDAGLVWVGDPCYFWDGQAQGQVGKTWEQFCDTLNGIPYPQHKSYDGYGVVAQTGYGDGTYPVYASVENGRITSLTIRFVEEEEEVDEDSEEEYEEEEGEEE